MSRPPWYRFRVCGPGGQCDQVEKLLPPLDSVAHVAHVPTALRIIEDRRLRADLVFDKSKLNTERIRVVWLSPNDWHGAGGFRYGNIRFHFEWERLISGKRVYWVESIAYGIPACRILLTDEDYSNILEPCNPTIGDGSWWASQSGKHYWNDNFCLEVMVEGDLDLDLVTEVSFVTHHPRYCNIDWQTCPYRGRNGDIAGAEFIAAVISRQCSLDLPGLVVEGSEGPAPSWSLYGAVNLLQMRIGRECGGVTGYVARSDPSARALARAILGSYASSGNGGDIKRLAAFFKSVDDLKGAILDVIAEASGLPDASALSL